jgi:hypothetical protein
MGFVHIHAPVIGNRCAAPPTASGSVTVVPASAGVDAKPRRSASTGYASACVWRVTAGKVPRLPESRGTQYETQWGWKLR